ncbi:UNVERIFIED_CONTAM: hypothetical protein RF648_17735 [Kocuria sp. CPCC 205274]|uniref:Uncharacterized protein n=2 Tax=Actinomycetes TaxID=1760 RepID=A0A7K3WK59_9ACTN|nr:MULTISPECIES: hypothetical protein [Actinomycetes]MCS5736734.1 hypothetical protein [Herbiconiux daphne]NEL56712.1 hypothetical protein [Goekera deserti]
MTKATKTLDSKAIFNALANAKHIFSFKEEGTKIKLLKIVETDENCKAVIMTEDGEIDGLFTDSASARQSLKEVMAVFGDEQPFITIKLKTTAKGASVYYVEVE